MLRHRPAVISRWLLLRCRRPLSVAQAFQPPAMHIRRLHQSTATRRQRSSYPQHHQHSLESMIADAQSAAHQSNPQKQRQLLEYLLENNQPQRVVQYFEEGMAAGGRFQFDSHCTRMYVEALNELGQAEKALAFVQSGVRNAATSSSSNSSSTFGGGAGWTSSATTSRSSRIAPPSFAPSPNASLLSGGGTKENPIHVLARPAPQTSKEKFWSAVKFGVLIWAGVALYTLYSEEIGRVQGKTFNVFTENTGKDDPVYKFDDVQGVDEAKEELQEIVEFLRDPGKFTRLGGKLPKGVLLTGPPGTGKTLLARAIAGEASVPFIHCSGSEFDEMFVGVGAKRVRELFATAKKKSPCIIFIDEIDAVGGRRNPRDQQWAKMTLNQLLVEMDGFDQNEGIIIIGATNFPESLDSALIRPGRFDRSVVVSIPDVKGRFDILKVHTRKVPLNDDVKLNTVARATPGFSGADLANLVNHAALRAAALDLNSVGMKEMEWAIDRILMGAEKKNKVMSENSRKLVAFHEAGHAMVALYTPGSMPIHKATIMPRGFALGMVSRLPEEDMILEPRKSMVANIDVAMGGRCSEELVFGPEEITGGAANDIQQATAQARAMVQMYGMSDSVGHVRFEKQDYSQYSTKTRELIESEVRRITGEAYDRAMNILKSHRVELDRLANALLEYETLSREEIEIVIKGGTLKRNPLSESAHTLEPHQRKITATAPKE